MGNRENSTEIKKELN